MNNRRITILLVATAFVIGAVVTVAHTLDSSQIEKTEAPKSQTMRRFPRIAFGSLAQHMGKLTFIQRTAFPVAPANTIVYKVQPLASKKDTLLGIFKSLPLTSSPETDNWLHRLENMPESRAQKEDPLSASIGGWNVKVWNGGQFGIENRELCDRLGKLEKSSPAPTPEEARKAADDFLAMIGPLPFPVHFSEVVIGEAIVSGAGDKPGDRVVTKLNVSYFAEIEGIPVYGAVGIQVGAGPAVVTMINRLRQVAPDQKLPILSPQEAFDKLRAGECHIGKGPTWNATGNVKSIKLAYLQDILAEDLSYVMPVYIFEGDAIADGMPTVPWKAFVEAVRPEFLETQPPLDSLSKRLLPQTTAH